MVHSDPERDAKSLTLALISASGEYMASVVLQSFVAVEQPVVAERLAVAERAVAALELVPMPQALFVRHHRPPCSGMLK